MEAGKNLSPNRAEKNVSIALAESRALLSSRRATCTPVLPCSDKPHAKGKLEKRSRTRRKEKKKKKKPRHLSAGAQQKREAPISHTKSALAGKNKSSSTLGNVGASPPTPGCGAGVAPAPSPTWQLQGRQVAASHSSAKQAFAIKIS